MKQEKIEIFHILDAKPVIGTDVVVYPSEGSGPEIRAFYTYANGKCVWRPLNRMVELPVLNADQWFYIPAEPNLCDQ